MPPRFRITERRQHRYPTSHTPSLNPHSDFSSGGRLYPELRYFLFKGFCIVVILDDEFYIVFDR